MAIDQQKVADTQSVIENMGSQTNASQETIDQMKIALETMAAVVEAGGDMQHVHTGDLNLTVGNVNGRMVTRVNATTRSGRSKMASGHLDATEE